MLEVSWNQKELNNYGTTRIKTKVADNTGAKEV
jgi:hypothetical protein